MENGLKTLKEYKESLGLDGNVQYSQQAAQESQSTIQDQGKQTAQGWAGDPMQNSHTQGSCPACGHCPHCGRGGYHTVPYTPYPYPYTGPYWGPIGTGTITCGQSDFTMASGGLQAWN
jgi:hypothetical protein